MLKKNSDLYKEKYDQVSNDQLERINEFLIENKFSKKDIDKFWTI